MAIIRKLQEYLESQKVPYRTLPHEEVYTAPEIAHALHVSGKLLAKVVIVKVDDRFVMAVLPSHWQIDLAKLQAVFGTDEARLATEKEFSGFFPECEVGSMPPFGNLYGLEVYIDRSLTEDEEIFFQAGTHREVVQMRYMDFANLVQPQVAEFHQTAA